MDVAWAQQQLARRETRRGLQRAKAVVGTDTPRFGDLAPVLHLASFTKRVPSDLRETAELVQAMCDLLVESDPTLLDVPPTVETAVGTLSVAGEQRYPALETLASNPDGGGGKNRKLLGAAVALDEHLNWIELFWTEATLEIWRALLDAEALARSALATHLVATELLAADLRERYLQGSDPALPRLTADFYDMCRAVRTVAARRRAVDLDAVKTEKTVVDFVSLAMSAVAIVGAVNSFTPVLDAGVQRRLADAAHLAGQAQRNLADATVAYLTVLRQQAERHPIVLVLDHAALGSTTVTAMARAVDEALTNAVGAMHRIHADGVRRATVAPARGPGEANVAALAATLAGASGLSVWKLPFFVERAVGAMRPRDGHRVVRMMDTAATVDATGALGRNLAFFGVDAAMLGAAAAGPVGMGLALAWALFNLGNSLHEYVELQTLYAASIDPSVLLRGLEHGPASKVAVVLDVIGVLLP